MSTIEPISAKRRRYAMTLRLLVYSQVAWLFFIAMLVHGYIPLPGAILDNLPHWLDFLLQTALLLLPAYLLPVLVIVTSRRVRLPRMKMALIVVAEVLFVLTYFIATIPAL